MKTKYTGTQTEKNLEAAFAGESQARNKYTYFASKAKKDGFEQIAAIFLETADNEYRVLAQKDIDAFNSQYFSILGLSNLHTSLPKGPGA